MNNYKNRRSAPTAQLPAKIAILWIMTALAPASADDISVFTSSLQTLQKPNVLFVLDYSSSMNDDINGGNPAVSGLPAKIDILRSSMTTLLADSAELMNVGLGPLYSARTGGIKWPVGPLNAEANAIDPSVPAGVTSGEVMDSLITNRLAGSGTGIVSALTEAALYFRGGVVANGGALDANSAAFTPQSWNPVTAQFEGGDPFAPHPSTYLPDDAYLFNAPGDTGTSYCADFSGSDSANHCLGLVTHSCQFLINTTSSGLAHNHCAYDHDDEWNGASYKSPITSECQENHIILLSDGRPSKIGNFDALENILGHARTDCEDLSGPLFLGTRTEGNCGPELAAVLSGNDQIPSISGSKVYTSTIGFSVSDTPGAIEYLNAVAEAGQGSFYEANTPEDLLNVFNQFVEDIEETNESFVELTVDIDKANFSHDNKVFFPMFTPSLQQTWQGNLKGYFLGDEGLIDLANQPATETSDSGTRFKATARSFWSTVVDGNNVALGGASSLLNPSTRNLYTFVGTDISPSGIELASSDDYLLDTGNDLVTNEVLEIPDDAATREQLLTWIREQPMGAPLHSKAQIVNYPNDQKVVYTMTNQGFLHAIDASSPTSPDFYDTSGGSEIFAFMPQELLSNIRKQNESNFTGEHIYGLDGGITTWHDDANSDGIVNGSDTVLLIFGMRRGGNSYYALEVTNPDSPILRWQITGGEGEFANLAQSWSRASLIRVNRDGTEERILVFGGGYDDVRDDTDAAAPSLGNSIFMVDREGELIWAANHALMQYAIPSDLTTIDSDDDGLADRLYAGDLGSQVWRIDFDDVDEADDFSIFRLADLAGAGYQPFFYPPSIAMIRTPSRQFISVSLGTGNRDMPMTATSTNAFYMLRDLNYEKGEPDAGTVLITQTNLYDATDNEIDSDDNDVAEAERDELREATGWRIDLQPGEKSLSHTVTFENRLLATTFKPLPGLAADVCSPIPTIGRFYMMDIVDGSPGNALDSSTTTTPTTTTAEDRYEEISTFGIPSAPAVVFPEGSGTVQIFVDKEAVSEISQTLEKTLWFGSF